MQNSEQKSKFSPEPESKSESEYESEYEAESDSESDSESGSKSKFKQPKRNVGKKSIYDGCQILDPQDNVVGVCGYDRIEWYLKKNLATKINDTTIKLLFEPNYRNDKSRFVKYIKRKNMCCVCGDENTNLMKFHTVPHEFKKYLPNDWKRHNSFDILPLCSICSCDGNTVTHDYKKMLEEKYNISDDHFIDTNKQNIKNLSRILVSGRKHAVERTTVKEKLISILGYEPDENELENLMRSSDKKLYDGSNNCAEYIIKQVCMKGNDEIKEFINGWKQFFVQEMNPEEIPADFYCINFDHN
jgi:hypothetical protein